MNKRTKIIVSIVGITIVLLALLGITYAYYLTRIQGNTNTNSISITTADLKLVYSENTPEIITENNIVPGTTIGEKIFTVSNTGNSAVENYKVVLEYAVIENVVPSVFVRPQDFEITLTCVSKNIETNEVSGTCRGYTGKWNNESFEMTTNDIAENIKHEYSLTIFYANPDIDQSDDMGKNLNLKVQIYGANETSTITGTIDNVDETYAMKLNSNPKISTIKNVGTKENPKYQYKFIGVEPNTGNDSHTLTLVNKSNVEQSTGNITIKKGTNANIDGSTITVKDNQTNIFLTTTNGSSLTNSATFNPYSNNTNSLAYHIINNSINKTNGTEYRDNPLTKPGKNVSLANESELSFIEDSYGVSYYFRGNVKDNFVTFDNKCWRIVRIQGDGSIKLVLADDQAVCSTNTLPSVETNQSKHSAFIAESMYGFSMEVINGKPTKIINFINGNTLGGGYTRIIDYLTMFYEGGTINEPTTSFNLTFDGIKNMDSYIKLEKWCLGDTTNAYDWNTFEKLERTAYNQRMYFGNMYVPGFDESQKENFIKENRFYYESRANIKSGNVDLICEEDNDFFEQKIGLLTGEEVVYAGHIYKQVSETSYINDNAKDYPWWTLSSASFGDNANGIKDFVVTVNNTGILNGSSAYGVYQGSVDNPYVKVRPVIGLKNGVTISQGVGTIDNPYVIE